MNSNEFKNIIAKGIFQREFAKSSGINRSVLNDIINGKNQCTKDLKEMIEKYKKVRIGLIRF